MELKAAIQSRCQLECPLLDRASKDKTELLSEPNELPDELHRSVESALNATVIIQHDPRDIDKLPAFPAAAK
jgi:hypothetical protein